MPINNPNPNPNPNPNDFSILWNDYESEMVLKSDLRGSAAVLPGNTSVLVTATVGNEIFYLMGFRASSQGDSLFQLYLNGELIASKRTMAAVLDCELKFPGRKKLKSGDVLLLQVTNNFLYDTIDAEGEIYAQ